METKVTFQTAQKVHGYRCLSLKIVWAWKWIAKRLRSKNYVTKRLIISVTISSNKNQIWVAEWYGNNIPIEQLTSHPNEPHRWIETPRGTRQLIGNYKITRKMFSVKRFLTYGRSGTTGVFHVPISHLLALARRF